MTPPPQSDLPDTESIGPVSEAAEVAGEISSEQVKQRAVKGASAMMVRGLAIRAAGLLGNIVLARLLTPEDFGIAALGVTIIAFSAALSDGGLATLFVRSKEPPTRRDLQAAVAVQTYASLLVVAVTTIAALVIESTEAVVVATMVAPIALIGFRIPAFVSFERSLDFSPIIRVEIGETVVSLVVSIAAAVAGAGVWSFVIGQVFRVVVGTTMMVRASPHGLILPRWDTTIIRGLLKYGAQFQGISVAGLGLAQGLNVAVAAAGGIAALGAWSLIWRLLQIPVLVFQGLRRVSYPGVARLLANGEDLGPILLRVSKLACVLGGVMVAAVAGGSNPGVVVLFGHQWESVQNLLPWCVAVVFINGPISVAAFSYATVAGKLTTALSSSAVQAVVGPLLVLALYSVSGLHAVAWATGAVALLDASVLGWVLWQGLKVNLLPTMLTFGGMTAAAGFAGHEIAGQIGPDGLAALAGAVSAELILFALIFALQPKVGRDAIDLALRSVRRGPAPAAASA